jgi:hypothetical protein
MIKEAMEYLLNKVNHEVKFIHDEPFLVTPNGVTHIKQPNRRTVDSFTVRTLTGLVDYINNAADRYSTEELVLHVQSHNKVLLMSALKNEVRDEYVLAEAHAPSIGFDKFHELENFNIMLQSCFEKTDDLLKILAVVGTVKEENVRTTGDDGITQTVTAKAGIARYDNVVVPNPVMLVPYRTFMEVEQPASKFVFRMQDGPRAALFEADGGAWKLEAMRNIKRYLEREITASNIKILA